MRKSQNIVCVGNIVSSCVSTAHFSATWNTLLLTLLTVKCVGVYPPTSNSETPAGWRTMFPHFWHSTQVARDPTGEGLRSTHDPTPFQMPTASPGCELSLYQLVINGGAHKPPHVWLTCWRSSEIRETLPCVYRFVLEGRDKGYRWTCRWKRCLGRGKWGGLQSWARPSPRTPTCPPVCKLSEPPPLGVFREAASCRHDQPLPPFPAPLTSLDNGGDGAEKFQAPNRHLYVKDKYLNIEETEIMTTGEIHNFNTDNEDIKIV